MTWLLYPTGTPTRRERPCGEHGPMVYFTLGAAMRAWWRR